MQNQTFAALLRQLQSVKCLAFSLNIPLQMYKISYLRGCAESMMYQFSSNIIEKLCGFFFVFYLLYTHTHIHTRLTVYIVDQINESPLYFHQNKMKSLNELTNEQMLSKPEFEPHDAANISTKWL